MRDRRDHYDYKRTTARSEKGKRGGKEVGRTARARLEGGGGDAKLSAEVQR